MHRLLQKRISRTRLHDAFTEPRLPPWDTVDALVEILASRAPGRTPQLSASLIDEINADSLLVLEAAGRIERCFDIELDEDGLIEAETIEEIVGLALMARGITREGG
ncbi:acyl carrier protein [Streptomyces sp. HD]|uniref:acyl carrier protein n=1 Tax=Streptomyces sp. HD TaxID=3020892 RepID=UPI00232BF6F3|nr:phosphopantetheine-binding protein [Streptomyces sp. HD]MDC0769592.1 phosphopantetheine-binding protein [Streptomyces sp. HD]